MIYAFTLIIVALLALIVYIVRQNAAERGDLLNRIQAPGQTVSQALTEKSGPTHPAAYISAFDDEATAEYEAERDRLARETQELILANTGPE